MQLYATRTKGFTLIELVVAMLIAGILAAIAIPAYNSYVRKARRTEAKTALLDLASLEERYFSLNNGYTSTPSLLGYPGTTPGATFPVGSGLYYQVTVTNVTPPTLTAVATYFLTAVPIPGSDQVNDTTCTQYTLDNTGTQGATPAANIATCWH